MTCHSASKLLSAFLDHELKGDEMLDVREHLEYCEACSQELAGLTEMKTMLRSLRPSTADEALESRLKVHVMGAPPSVSVRRARMGWGAVVTTAAVAATFAFMVYSATRPIGQGAPADSSVPQVVDATPMGPSDNYHAPIHLVSNH